MDFQIGNELENAEVWTGGWYD